MIKEARLCVFKEPGRCRCVSVTSAVGATHSWCVHELTFTIFNLCGEEISMNFGKELFFSVTNRNSLRWTAGMQRLVLIDFFPSFFLVGIMFCDCAAMTAGVD